VGDLYYSENFDSDFMLQLKYVLSSWTQWC